MRTTIDAAGRIVIPKSVRESMGLTAGRQIDVIFTDGRIEIELVPAEVEVRIEDAVLPRVVATGEAPPPLTDEDIRAALEATRR